MGVDEPGRKRMLQLAVLVPSSRPRADARVVPGEQLFLLDRAGRGRRDVPPPPGAVSAPGRERARRRVRGVPQPGRGGPPHLGRARLRRDPRDVDGGTHAPTGQGRRARKDPAAENGDAVGPGHVDDGSHKPHQQPHCFCSVAWDTPDCATDASLKGLKNNEKHSTSPQAKSDEIVGDEFSAEPLSSDAASRQQDKLGDKEESEQPLPDDSHGHSKSKKEMLTNYQSA